MVDARDIDYTGTLDATNVNDALDELARRAATPGQKGKDGTVDLAPLVIAVAELATRARALDGEPGDDGDDGEDADPAIIAEMVHNAVTAAVAKIPPAKDGDPGPPGKNADPTVLAELVGQAIAAIPPPQQGAPGAPGQPGTPGVPGEGVPEGGDTGYILAKRSAEDFDTEWIRLPKGLLERWGLWGPGAAQPASSGTGNTNTTFGLGDPSGSADAGTLYFDTTDPDAYMGWVYNAGAWHPFSGTGTPTLPGTGPTNANSWFFFLGN